MQAHSISADCVPMMPNIHNDPADPVTACSHAIISRWETHIALMPSCDHQAVPAAQHTNQQNIRQTT